MLLVTYIWAMLVSLLPYRYRKHLSMHRSSELLLGAILCGGIQTIIFGIVFLVTFMNQKVKSRMKLGPIVADEIQPAR